VEGPIGSAVWKLAWPTMLQNVIGGLQGLVDHTMVGHYVGYTGNAAIGVSWQIYLVVVVFISSLFSGMGVLVARFAGQGDSEKVNRTVYQAFLVAALLSVGVLAPLGYFLAPSLLHVVNATPTVQAEALPYLRTLFVFSFGTLMFFMVGGAFRSAGDARTPLRLGVALTILNIILNVIFIAGVGPVPAFGTLGAAMGTVMSGGIISVVALWIMFSGRAVVQFHRGMNLKPDWDIIRELFRFGLPTGLQGVAMNVGGVLLLRFVGSLQESAEAQAAYVIAYTQLFSFVTWSSQGLLGAAAAVAGQNLGAHRPDRSVRAVRAASLIGLTVAVSVGFFFLVMPQTLLSAFGIQDQAVVHLGATLLRVLSLSGLFITVALAHTGGLQGTGDTKSPLYISVVSQLVIPLGICFVLQSTTGLHAMDIWLAILCGHFARAVLSVIRFRQGKWRKIKVHIEPAST
jgi:putative MATE family efflux protein